MKSDGQPGNTQTTVQHLQDKLWFPHGLPQFWPSVAREFVPPKPHPAALDPQSIALLLSFFLVGLSGTLQQKCCVCVSN